jgi:hypothetical protein
VVARSQSVGDVICKNVQAMQYANGWESEWLTQSFLFLWARRRTRSRRHNWRHNWRLGGVMNRGWSGDGRDPVLLLGEE